MKSDSVLNIPLGNDETRPVRRQPDGESFYLHCTGGIRAAQVNDTNWVIEPILNQGRATAKGFFSRQQLHRFLDERNIPPIALHHTGWRKGGYFSFWVPIITGQSNHMIGASDLWMNISSNIGRAARRSRLSTLKNPTREEAAEIFDDQTPEERLSQFIGLSLRSMDISVEQVSDFYNEHLTLKLNDGDLDGQRSATTLDQNLYSHVHSFFLHAGAARDYLSNFIALRIGEDAEKVDSLAKLTGKLRSHHFGKDNLLDLLVSNRLIVKSAQGTDKWETSGWLKDMTELRNRFIHRQPYGSRHAEHFGWIEPVNAPEGIYRYKRPSQDANGSEADILDLIHGVYKSMISLFYEMANACGHDNSMMTVTGADIISMTIE